MKSKLKLEQGQIWKQGDAYYRIVKWARLAIEYKAMKDPASKEGTLHQVSKKEFCRLIKGATLMTPEMLAAMQFTALPGEPELIDISVTEPAPETE